MTARQDHRPVHAPYAFPVLAILLVLVLSLAACGGTTGSTTTATSVSASEKTYTLAELAGFDGLNGNKAYIAVDGIVYDVTAVAQWGSRLHAGKFQAGKDYSQELKSAPHGIEKLLTAVKIGMLETTTPSSTGSNTGSGEGTALDTVLLGRVLGWLIVTGYTLTVLNYFVKRINRRFISELPADSPARKRYTVFLRFIVRYHRYFAIVTSVALFAHFTIQYLSRGFYLTGVIAGGLLVVQSFLGAFGTYVKKKKAGLWLYIHRTVAVLLFAAILLHVLTVVLGLPIR